MSSVSATVSPSSCLQVSCPACPTWSRWVRAYIRTKVHRLPVDRAADRRHACDGRSDRPCQRGRAHPRPVRQASGRPQDVFVSHIIKEPLPSLNILAHSIRPVKLAILFFLLSLLHARNKIGLVVGR